MARLNGTGGAAGIVTARAEQCKTTHMPGFIAARQFGVGFRFRSVAAPGRQASAISASRRIAELPWMRIAGEFGSQFGQERNLDE